MVHRETLNIAGLNFSLALKTIVTLFDELNVGESIIIQNEDDPKLLYYQLIKAKGNRFLWEYLEEEPHHWKVKITKHSETKPFMPISVGVEPLKRVFIETNRTSNNFKNWELDRLTQHIVATHHSYVKDNFLSIVNLTESIANLSGKSDVKSGELREIILHFLSTLMEHLKKEEDVLFPKIKHLMIKKRNPEVTMGVPFGFVKNGAIMLQMEHEQSLDNLKLLRSVTNDYAIPNDGFKVYYYLFEKLKEFEEDLFQHMRLESNILFPKAAALEDQLASRL
jgi:regulator of cell morphogenesis and NO signaling